jgi:uroporphyrin-III C-methyltransferase/precorrin-2 dehydrogenase/sirohydrochlorin ferrochelatase
LFDERVSPEILDFARREAKKMLVGKTGDALMVSLARAGRRVVRLTGGDGRAGAEIAACRAAGVSITIVPGVTSGRVIAGDAGLEETASGNRRLAEQR